MNQSVEEIWKICPIAPFWEISNRGAVKSLKSGKVLSPCDNGNGYLYVSKVFGKKKKHYYIHRLVAITFIENKGNYPQVNHIDGNKKNNAVHNLEWCTRSQNILHAHKNGLAKPSDRQRKKARETAISNLPALRAGHKRWITSETGKQKVLAHLAKISALGTSKNQQTG